jgi:hypothetical protein
VFSLRHQPIYRSHRVTLPRLKHIKDTLGVLNSPNNGILIGIGQRGGGSDPLWLCWRGKPWLAIRWGGYAAFKWSQSERQLILGRRAITNRDIETALN